MYSTIYLFDRGRYLYSNRLYTTEVDLASLRKQSRGATKLENINFNPNDALTTSVVINSTNPYYNYCYNETDNTRWFIIKRTENNGNQETLSLVRDVFSDYYDHIVNSDILITKANQITPATSKSQYNKTTSLSQIKVGETLLSEGGTANGWIYLYMAKDLSKLDNLTFTTSTNMGSYSDTISDTLLGKLGTNPVYVYERKSAWIQVDVDFRKYTGPSLIDRVDRVDFNLNVSGTNYDSYTKTTRISDGVSVNSDEFDIVYDSFKATASSSIQMPSYSVSGGLDDSELVSLCKNYAGKVLYNTTNRKLYKLNVLSKLLDTPVSSELTDTDKETLVSDLDLEVEQLKYSKIFLNIDLYQIQLEEVAEANSTSSALLGNSVQLAISSSRLNTINAVYDVYAIPLGGTIKSGINTYTVKNDFVMALVNYMVTKLKTSSSSYLYDIQWLPYGPNFRTNGVLDVYKIERSIITSIGDPYSYITDEGGKKIYGICMYLSSNKISYDIDSEIIAKNSTDLLENRIENETTFYRLCSPNWSSTFEFKPILNNGLSGYEVDVTAKPYTPYVRVCPRFRNMYGTTYNDARGLILAGDFSVDQMTSAWESYKLTNKNYELIFNRQIQTMDLNNSVALQQDKLSRGLDIFSAVNGSVSGAGYGAMVGSSGGVVGSAIGAVVGGTTGFVGGIADLAINDKLRSLNKSLRIDARNSAIDNYQYQLGNIQALPNSLSKTSSFDASYRVYPILEKYSCSEEEKQQLRLSIQWNGIDINQISTIKEQLANGSGELFIKGELLRFNATGIEDEVEIDYRINDQIYGVIAELLANGIYIERSTE